MHNRSIPVAAKELRGPAGKPVVAVNRVVAHSVSQGKERGGTGEFGQQREHIVFGDHSSRAGLQADDPHSLRDVDNIGRVLVLASSEDVDVYSETIQLTSEVADV